MGAFLIKTMGSRYHNKYFKPDEPLVDTEAKLRQLITVDGKYYAILMIGVAWLPDIGMLEFNPERCVVGEVDGNGEIKGEKMYNVLLTLT